MASYSVWIGSDNLVEWQDPTNLADGSALSAATATFTLRDSDGTALATNVAMTLSGTDYQGVLESTITDTLVEGDEYTLEVTLSQAGLVGVRQQIVTARYKPFA